MKTPRWYAIRTRSRAEKVVHEQIAQRGIESFLPLMTRVSQWKDRRKDIRWPLFPGYCFAKFTNDQTLCILQVPGAIEIIGSALGRPEPIPDGEITALQRVISSLQPYEAHSQFVEGMVVQVIRGPLSGLQGKLLKKTDGCRLIITINLIGQGAAVHIDADDIAPVPSSSHLNSLSLVPLACL
ncbi:MAG: UpxY family transcription antiterminator [Nitrospirota bacterium]|nr:UpxY family transcription antiterminator [Nitrospirota bacterium]